jgi:hypothetical protein
LPNAGHWILEEKPKETTDALLKFLDLGGKWIGTLKVKRVQINRLASRSAVKRVSNEGP